LLEELRGRPLTDGGNLLILVDQFEELFRYQGLAGREEAEAVVAVLLESARQDAVPIYIVLTMRSDFLGRCADFDGLAEAVSDAQYLCPRLSRDQIRAAIEGPAEVFGGRVEPRLVSRIVNDMGTDPDQLPLMQHALMRLWERARSLDTNAPQLRLDDYEAEGGIKGSLSRHADEILAEVTRGRPERADTARRLFCLLTEGEGENAVRRLARVSEALEVTGGPLGEIAAVADAFRAPGRSLLMPAAERPLAPDTILDISHESLIRQWQERFLDESRARRDNADAERREQERRIIVAEEAVERQRVEAQAEQRRVALVAAEERAFAASRLARRTRVGLMVMSVLLAIAAGLAWWGLDSAREARYQRIKAESQRVEAEMQRGIAEDAAKEAQQQKAAAEQAERVAEAQKERAERLADELRQALAKK